MVEPSFIALGPFHMAVGINDRAWIYEIQENGKYMYVSTLHKMITWNATCTCM